MATTYPYTQTAPLSNSVVATTVVNIVSGMQVSTTTFNSNGVNIGVITLSPVDTQKADVKFGYGKQMVTIDIITFQALSGMQQGQVNISGNATDTQGKNPVTFNALICSWS